MNVALRTVSEHAMRPVWKGDDGALRIGHSGDVVTMLDDLGHPTQGSVRPANCCRAGEHAPELARALNRYAALRGLPLIEAGRPVAPVSIYHA